MRKRWLTAIIGIPLTVGIWLVSSFWQEIPMFFLILIAGLVLNFEILNMVKDKKEFHYPFFRIGIMMTLSLIFTYLYGMKLIEFPTFIISHCIFFMVFFYWIIGNLLFKAHDISENFEHIGVYTIVYITFVVLFPLVFLIKVMFTNAWAIILLFTFCWVSDAFGLFIGSALGKHPIPSLPSRSKTVEGYFGAFIFTVLLGFLFYYIQGFINLPFQWSLPRWLLFGACMNLSSGFGDLLESLIKRWGEKKDSSNIIPGMGGLFDSIDAQIYSIPIVLLFFNI